MEIIDEMFNLSVVSNNLGYSEDYISALKSQFKNSNIESLLLDFNDDMYEI